MQAKIIDPSKDKRWDEFVTDHPQGTLFHLSNWARVLQKTYGYIPCYSVLEDSDKKIKAGCPFFLVRSWLTGTRLVCLPFTDNCLPLAISCENIELLFAAAIEKANQEKADYIEVRGEHPNISLQGLHFENHSYYRLFRLDLSRGKDSVWKGLGKRVRRRVRRAQRTNLIIEKSETEKGMRDFYLLNLATRKKHGIPPQPYIFFETIWQELILNGLGFVLFAKYQGIPIAGDVFFIYKDTIYDKFSAWERNYSKYCPNHLVKWHIIQYGCQNRFRYLDSGRTSQDNLGLMAFKRGWGMEEIDLPYYYWPTVKGVTPIKERSLKYRMISSVMRWAPTAISRAAGELFYKHLG